MDNILSEKEVKQKLGIKDFRHITKDQIIQFMSNIPNMDKELAMKCIDQFPNFTKTATEIVNHYYDICRDSMKESYKDSIKAKMLVLESLSKDLESENLSTDDKRYIIEMLVSIADEIEKIDDKKIAHNHHVLATAGQVLQLTIVSAAALLGIKVWKR